MFDPRKASRLFAHLLTSYILVYPGPKRLPIFLIVSLLVLSLIPRLSLGLALDSTPGGAAQGALSFVEDNPTCPAGTIEFKVEPVADGTYSNGTLTVTIAVRDTPEGQVFDFTANIGLDAVIAKGGPDGNVYLYDPEVNAGTGLHAPMKPNNDQFYSLGYIFFCYDNAPSPHTPTSTPSQTPTYTSTLISTAIPTHTPTETSEVPSTATATPTETATATTVPLPVTITPSLTDSPTPTSTPTATPSHTPTATAPPTLTNPPVLPTATSTPPPTGTSQVPATATGGPTATAVSPPVTITPTDSLTPSATSTSTPTATPSVTPSATAPAASGHLSITKRDFLFSDADHDDRVSSGDTLYYEITVMNDGVGTTPQLRVADMPDPTTRLLIGSVKVIGGVIVQGNHAGDDQVTVEVTPLISGAHATVSLQVVVSSSITTTQLQNQALVTTVTPDDPPSGQAPLISDDPDTAAPDDATITLLTEPLVAVSPSLFLPLIHNRQP